MTESVCAMLGDTKLYEGYQLPVDGKLSCSFFLLVTLVANMAIDSKLNTSIAIVHTCAVCKWASIDDSFFHFTSLISFFFQVLSTIASDFI